MNVGQGKRAFEPRWAAFGQKSEQNLSGAFVRRMTHRIGGPMIAFLRETRIALSIFEHAGFGRRFEKCMRSSPTEVGTGSDVGPHFAFGPILHLRALHL